LSIPYVCKTGDNTRRCDVLLIMINIINIIDIIICTRTVGSGNAPLLSATIENVLFLCAYFKSPSVAKGQTLSELQMNATMTLNQIIYRGAESRNAATAHAITSTRNTVATGVGDVARGCRRRVEDSQCARPMPFLFGRLETWNA
jgi:hypothetical protein